MLAHIYQYEPGARIVLDAILLSLAEIVSKESPPRSVAILPEMKVKEVLFNNPVTGQEVWFDGSLDYAIIEYEDSGDNKGKFLPLIIIIWPSLFLIACLPSDRLVAPGTSRTFVFEIASSHMFLVEPKRHNQDRSLAPFIPEAVTQAMAFSELSKWALFGAPCFRFSSIW